MDNWIKICRINDLVENSGVCALVKGKQIALFHLPQANDSVYAIDNWDPIAQANVLYRGIIGSIKDQTVVASPLYKQHFSLLTGQCLQDDNIRLTTYQTRIVDQDVELKLA